MTDDIAEVTEVLHRLAPLGAPVPIRTPLESDECTYFLRAINTGLVSFTVCPADCFRSRKWGSAGPDHFETPAGKPRHLFSKPSSETAWLNREYIPHIAAYCVTVNEYGYDARQSSFSLYRKFSRDLIAKREGQGYETDAEFYDSAGGIHLQIEAKASKQQTATLAAAIEQHGELIGLPLSAVKEVEYVLDLAPAFLWVVGPTSVYPPRHVYQVEVDGNNASFTPVEDLPPPAP